MANKVNVAEIKKLEIESVRFRWRLMQFVVAILSHRLSTRPEIGQTSIRDFSRAAVGLMDNLVWSVCTVVGRFGENYAFSSFRGVSLAPVLLVEEPVKIYFRCIEAPTLIRPISLRIRTSICLTMSGFPFLRPESHPGRREILVVFPRAGLGLRIAFCAFTHAEKHQTTVDKSVDYRAQKMTVFLRRRNALPIALSIVEVPVWVECADLCAFHIWQSNRVAHSFPEILLLPRASPTAIHP